LTVTGKFYLPNYLHMHAYAGVLNKVLLSVPLFAMATISVKARSNIDDFDFVKCTAAQTQAIQSYVGVVEQTQETMTGYGNVPIDKIRKLAMVWIEGEKSGKLKPLPPVCFDDTTRDGLKNEILRANLRPAEELNDTAEQECDKHQYWTATQDATLGAKVADVTKYSDFASLSCNSLCQRRSIRIIESCYPHLTSSQRMRTLKDLAICRSNRDEIIDMAEQARLSFLRYLIRKNTDLGAIQQIQHAIGENQAYKVSIQDLAQEMHQRLDKVNDMGSASLLADIRMACMAALDGDRKLAQLTKHV